MDEMTSPTRIFNCFNGHICEGCKQKLKQPVYPKCRTNIIGRATDIENYLTIASFDSNYKLSTALTAFACFDSSYKLSLALIPVINCCQL